PPVTLAGERVRLRSHRFQPLVDPVDDPLLGGNLLRSDVGHSAPPVSASLLPDEHMYRSAGRNHHSGRSGTGCVTDTLKVAEGINYPQPLIGPRWTVVPAAGGVPGSACRVVDPVPAGGDRGTGCAVRVDRSVGQVMRRKPRATSSVSESTR